MGLRDLFGGRATTPGDLEREAEAARQAAGPVPSAPVDPMIEIAQLALAGEKIDAIKLHREAFGTSLADAKLEVEALARGEVPAPAAPPTAAPEEDAEILALVGGGAIIDAIKAYRDRYGVGLEEAKEAVERMRA